MRLVFECDDCKRRVARWETMRRHLNQNPDNALVHYGVVVVYREA